MKMLNKTLQSQQTEACQCDICQSQDVEAKECSHLTGLRPEASSRDRKESFVEGSKAGGAAFPESLDNVKETIVTHENVRRD
jgi:hypothetical protein